MYLGKNNYFISKLEIGKDSLIVQIILSLNLFVSHKKNP